MIPQKLEELFAMKLYRKSGGFTLAQENGFTNIQNELPDTQARYSTNDEIEDEFSPRPSTESVLARTETGSSLSRTQAQWTSTPESIRSDGDSEQTGSSLRTPDEGQRNHQQHRRKTSAELTLRPRPQDIIYRPRTDVLFQEPVPDETLDEARRSTDDRLAEQALDEALDKGRLTFSDLKPAAVNIESSSFESSAETLLKRPITNQYQWYSGLTFQLCSIATLFNLGSVWRFPSMALENYGGSFVYVYLLSWLFIGLPVLVLEQMVGQFVLKNPWRIWNCVPLFRGIAVSQCILSTYLMAMYFIVIAWFGIYFATSFTNPLPWNSSLVEVCQTLTDGNSSCRNASVVEEYFRNDVLNLADLDHISSCDWRAIVAILISAVLVVLLSLYQQRIFEVVAPILTAILVALIVGLLVYACTRDGAGDGIAYFFTPQWNQLGSQVWYSALTQVVYSHNIGLGVHVSMSSCNEFKWPVVRYAITSSILAMLFSLLSGMAAFALLGNLSTTMNVPVRDAVQLGYGLEYIVISSGVATTAWPAAWSATIFAILFVCGTTSPTTYMLNVASVLRGQLKQIFSKELVVILPLALIAFAIGLVFTTQGGLYFLKIFDVYGVSVPSLVCLALETIGLLWIYGLRLFQVDFSLMTLTRAKWIALASFCTPCLIAMVAIAAFVQFDLVTLDGMEIPAWGHGLGGILLALAILPILLCMIYVTSVQLDYGFLGKLQMAIRPTSTWGPNEYRHRQTWLTNKVESFRSNGTISRHRTPIQKQPITETNDQNGQGPRTETMPDVVPVGPQSRNESLPNSTGSSPHSQRSQNSTENKFDMDQNSSWALY